MRFIVRVKIPTEAGNKNIQDPKFIQTLEEYISKVKPEASYFFEADGDRVSAFVVNMDSADMIPAIAEPLFQGMNSNVEIHHVCSLMI
jgi:hypothetical protein